MTADVAIAGAGMIGTACARALAAEGLKVIVAEGAYVGSGATSAGMGHVVVMDDSEAQFALTRHSRDLWDRLLPGMPPTVEHEPCGTLWVAADDEEWDGARRRLEYYQQRGIAAQLVDSRSLTRLEPSLREDLAGGLLVPGDSVVYAPAAAHWLAHHVPRVDSAVVALSATSMTLANGDVIEAGTVINATGSRSPELTPGIPVRPRKGHLAITGRYPGFVRHQLVELGYLKSAHGHSKESVAFNVQPRATGQVLIGSSRQYDAGHRDIDSPLLSRMLRRAVEYMPALARLQVIRAWTGFRAATPDSLPLIGYWHDGTFLATGHEGLGITTSLGTASLVAALITGRAPSITADPYDPKRFPCSA